MAVELTEKAAKELSRIMEEQESGQDYLRISLKGGGCSGFSYKMDFTKEATDFDEVFESYGVKILVDKKSYLYINGLVVDFNDGLLDRGFQFNNPNAKQTCGCGSSFGV